MLENELILLFGNAPKISKYIDIIPWLKYLKYPTIYDDDYDNDDLNYENNNNYVNLSMYEWNTPANTIYQNPYLFRKYNQYFSAAIFGNWNVYYYFLQYLQTANITNFNQKIVKQIINNNNIQTIHMPLYFKQSKA